MGVGKVGLPLHEQLVTNALTSEQIQTKLLNGSCHDITSLALSFKSTFSARWVHLTALKVTLSSNATYSLDTSNER